MRQKMHKIKGFFCRYARSTSGVAALEAALMFPTLMVMMVSMVDIGNGLLSNQKLISAAQITADLVTRYQNPTLDQRAEAVLAGQMAMSPYAIDGYQFNVTSFEFASDGNPDVVWQETNGLYLDADLTGGLSDLGGPGEGVVVVVVEYTYQPFFTGFIVGPLAMREVAYLRGRRSAVVGAPL